MRVKASNCVGSYWTPTTLSFVPQAGNSGFTPMDFSGLRLWLDASDLNGTGQTLATQSGESVSLIKDKSGQSRDATQTTSTSQPSFVYGALNGLPNLRFDGVNDYLDLKRLKPFAPFFWWLIEKLEIKDFY